MEKGAIQLSLETLIVIIFALLVMVIIIFVIGGPFLENLNFLNSTAFS